MSIASFFKRWLNSKDAEGIKATSWIDNEYVIVRKNTNRSFTPKSFLIGESQSPHVITTEVLSDADFFNTKQEKDVLLVIPNLAFKIERVPPNEIEIFEDKGFWGLIETGVIDKEGRDRRKFTGKNVKVALIDGGIDLNHITFRRLRTNDKISGYNYTANSDDINTKDPHGTCCASIIFGEKVRDNSGKICRVGVAEDVSEAFIYNIEYLDSNKDSLITVERIIDAIEKAFLSGAEVIAIPYLVSFTRFSKRINSLYQASIGIEYTLERSFFLFHDVVTNLNKFIVDLQMIRPFVVFASAGNNSQRHLNPNKIRYSGFPGLADSIKSIGSLQQESSGEIILDPGSHRFVSFIAPGDQTFAAVPGGGIAYFGNTSAAVSFACGISCLWIEGIKEKFDGAFTLEQLNSCLEKSSILPRAVAREYGALDYGYGMVQAPTNENFDRILNSI